MKNRIIFDIVLLATVFYAPWWLVVAVALTAAFLYPSYYEIIAAGVLFDILYGASSLHYGGMLGLICAIIIFFLGIYLRRIARL